MIRKDSIDRKEIEQLLPHRAPMLLIDKLTKKSFNLSFEKFVKRQIFFIINIYEYSCLSRY